MADHGAISELLLAWDTDPRPLIDLQGSVATHGWDMSTDYLDWYDEFSHPLVDPGSVRRDRPVGPIRAPPTVDAFAVVVADIRTYLRTPETATRTFEQHAALWLHMLTGQPHPMAPPPPRQSQMFRDSVTEPGEGSGSQPQ